MTKKISMATKLQSMMVLDQKISWGNKKGFSWMARPKWQSKVLAPEEKQNKTNNS